MTERDHTQIEELMAAEALGGLDPEDQAILDRERAAHAPCDGCRDIEASFAEVGGRLAFSLDPVPVDMAVADRILAQGGRPTRIPDLGASQPSVVPLPEAGPARSKRNRRGRRWAAAVGIAAVLVVALVISITVAPGLHPVGIHASSTQQIVQLTPASAGDVGELAMAYTPGSPGVVLWGSDMPDPGAGKVYELWTITGTTPVSGGCMEAPDGHIAAALTTDVDGADQVAITTESSVCPSAPTTAPGYAAALTT